MWDEKRVQVAIMTGGDAITCHVCVYAHMVCPQHTVIHT